MVLIYVLVFFLKASQTLYRSKGGLKVGLAIVFHTYETIVFKATQLIE